MDYDELISSVFLCFGIREKEFMDFIPKNIYKLLSLYKLEKLEKTKIDWERTRLQIYYNMEFKHPIPYKQFCLQYFPLAWDEKDEPKEITQELINSVFDIPVETKVEEIKDLSQLKGIL